MGRADTQGPRLDPADVTADRVDAKRKADLAAWAKLKSKGPLPDKISRGGLEQTLKARGYTKHRGDPDSYFTKSLSDRTIMLWLSLKTFGEGGLYAPRQRLLVTISPSTPAFSAIEAEIMDDPTPHFASIVSLGQRKFDDFVLTQPRVAEIIDIIETEVLDLDFTAALAQLRATDPARPGNAGLKHLTALALAGDIDTLDGYVRRRMDGDPCGFVPFITDEMIARAAKIAHRNG